MPDGTNQPALVTHSRGLHVRAVRDNVREADFVASTDAIDRDHEVIDQASWRLDTFKTNPVILYGHQSYELPIGQATRCEVVNGQLECTIKFATAEANPEAEKVWRLVQEKVLRAVSVGFRPTDGRYEIRNGEEVFVFYGCELREISVVAIPANPEALAKMKAAARANAAQEQSTEPSVAPASEPTIERAAEGATEHHMLNVKTILALLSLAETATEADVVDRVKGMSEGRAEAQAAKEKALAAEAKVKTLEAENASLKSEKDTLSKEHEKAATDRDAATKRADEAEAKLHELEVDALVGVKIAATEKDDFVKLRKDNPTMFKSMVEKRPDMKLTTRVTEENGAKGAGPAVAATSAGDLWNTL